MDIIDNFMKEFGLFNPNSNNNALTNINGSNNLSLVGNKITPTKFPDLDDEVLSTISNEILRFKSHKKDHLKNKIESNETSPLKSDGLTPSFRSSFMSPSAINQGNW